MRGLGSSCHFYFYFYFFLGDFPRFLVLQMSVISAVPFFSPFGSGLPFTETPNHFPTTAPFTLCGEAVPAPFHPQVDLHRVLGGATKGYLGCNLTFSPGLGDEGDSIFFSLDERYVCALETHLSYKSFLKSGSIRVLCCFYSFVL